jgi:hypothetical protein
MAARKKKLTPPAADMPDFAPEKADGHTWRLSISKTDRELIEAKAAARGLKPATYILNLIQSDENAATRMAAFMDLIFQPMLRHVENFQRTDDRLTVAQDFIATRSYVEANTVDLEPMLAKLHEARDALDKNRDEFNKRLGPDALGEPVASRR